MISKARNASSVVIFAAGISFLVAAIIVVAIFFNRAAPFYEQGYTPTGYHDAEVNRINDAQNINVDVHLGMDMELKSVTLRLAGIKTDSVTEVSGQRAIAFLKERIEDEDVIIKAFRQDEFGRWYAEIYEDGVNINQELIKRGLAVANHE